MKKFRTILSKKAELDLQWMWPEYSFFVLFIIGFLIAVLAPSPIFAQIFIGITGLMTGRYLYKRKGRAAQTPVYLVVYGFLFGFVLALIITHKADWKLAMIVYILGNMFSYYMHDKGFIND